MLRMKKSRHLLQVKELLQVTERVGNKAHSKVPGCLAVLMLPRWPHSSACSQKAEKAAAVAVRGQKEAGELALHPALCLRPRLLQMNTAPLPSSRQESWKGMLVHSQECGPKEPMALALESSCLFPCGSSTGARAARCLGAGILDTGSSILTCLPGLSSSHVIQNPLRPALHSCGRLPGPPAGFWWRADQHGVTSTCHIRKIPNKLVSQPLWVQTCTGLARVHSSAPNSREVELTRLEKASPDAVLSRQGTHRTRSHLLWGCPRTSQARAGAE